MTNQRIVAAALKLSSGQIVTKPPPVRHPTLILDANNPLCYEQGFLTDSGEFVDREEAYRIALKAKQLVPRQSDGPRLYTEDLW